MSTKNHILAKKNLFFPLILILPAITLIFISFFAVTYFYDHYKDFDPRHSWAQLLTVSQCHFQGRVKITKANAVWGKEGKVQFSEMSFQLMMLSLPLWWNSTTRQNQPIWDWPLYITINLLRPGPPRRFNLIDLKIQTYRLENSSL